VVMKKIRMHLFKDFQVSVGYGCGNMDLVVRTAASSGVRHGSPQASKAV